MTTEQFNKVMNVLLVTIAILWIAPLMVAPVESLAILVAVMVLVGFMWTIYNRSRP